MIAALLAVVLSLSDSTHIHYAQQNVEALDKLLRDAETRTDRLLCRYRLYPLTEDAKYLEDLPRQLDDGSAREWALLSGLWAFRAGEASWFNAIRYGRRSTDLLEEAKARDPDDPVVLLIEGQSFLFRPSFAGKDVERALERFETLQSVIERTQSSPVPMTEAQVWAWFALRELGRTDAANALRARLLATDPPPLFKQFLMDPPRS